MAAAAGELLADGCRRTGEILPDGRPPGGRLQADGRDLAGGLMAAAAGELLAAAGELLAEADEPLAAAGGRPTGDEDVPRCSSTEVDGPLQLSPAPAGRPAVEPPPWIRLLLFFIF
jgi:hypothetical protein